MGARKSWRWIALGSVVIAGTCLRLAVGCGSSDGNNDPGQNGTGGGGGFGYGGGGTGGGLITTDGSAGKSGGGSAGSAGSTCGSTIIGAAYDFHAGHPDFQCGPPTYPDFTDPYNKDCGPWDPAIVGALGSPIGSDRKPVYAASDHTPSTTGKANFDQWYRETPGVNMMGELQLGLSASGGNTYIYDTNRFFPIDGKLFAAEPADPDKGKYIDDDGNARNYHFTYELHTTFRYDQGNVFTFRGDDDVFVYINDKLVINLGGIHVPVQGRIFLDTGRVEITADTPPAVVDPRPDLGLPEAITNGAAGVVDLQLTAGEVYTMDFFFAERNCCGSNFRVETNLVFISCGEPPK